MEAIYFEESERSLGTVKEGEKIEVIFKAKKNIPVIEDIIVSCGCTKPRYSSITKELKVTYTVGSIKSNSLNSVNFSKTIEVIYGYSSHRKDILTISGTKIRKK